MHESIFGNGRKQADALQGTVELEGSPDVGGGTVGGGTVGGGTLCGGTVEGSPDVGVGTNG